MLDIEAFGDNHGRVGGRQARRHAYVLPHLYEATERMSRTRLDHRHAARDFFWLADIYAGRDGSQASLMTREVGCRLWRNSELSAPEFRTSSSE